MTEQAITLFSGMGVADYGIRAAGYHIVGAVEYTPAIADIYRRNHGDHVRVGDVRQMDWTMFPACDYLHASPPCPSFSSVNANRGETPDDIAVADAVCSAIATLQPRLFTLENVQGYHGSSSLRRIISTLERLDYAVEWRIVNAADYGVPQTRIRLVLVARSGGWMQPALDWGVPARWNGWYDAIADYIPDLPDTTLPPWQIQRMPTALRESMLISATNVNGLTMRAAHTPAPTVLAAHNPFRAVLLSTHARGTPEHNQYTVAYRTAHEPAWTCTAEPRQHIRALLLDSCETTHQPTVRIVQLTPPCLARFQSIPDTAWLPLAPALAVKAIGNGYPSLLAQRIVEMARS